MCALVPLSTAQSLRIAPVNRWAKQEVNLGATSVTVRVRHAATVTKLVKSDQPAAAVVACLKLHVNVLSRDDNAPLRQHREAHFEFRHRELSSVVGGLDAVEGHLSQTWQRRGSVTHATADVAATKICHACYSAN